MATYDLAYPGAAIDAILNTAYFLQEAGYIFQGSASEYSGTPSKRVWLIAPAGFTGLGLSSAVPQGSFGICLYNGTAWVGKVINVLTLDSAPTRNSQNGVTSGGVAATLDEIAGGIMETFASLLFDDETAAADLRTKLSYAVKFSVSDVYQTVTHLNILAATTSKAGLMSAEDKAKVDSFLTNLRSLTFTDTTASADQGTKITETLKATIGGVQEVIDSITLLAATSSKAGLLSASDKAYIDALPATLTSLSNSISGALALMQSLVGYYVCDTAAGTAAKTVTATGYSLTNGGCIRIKMTNANTANNVTLNINSTGAKALYYDGAQASSTNTWEAGEVLEVYYDGTQYQCASGGGGKFATGEKVKDTSITDTIAEGSTSLPTSGAVYDKFLKTSIICDDFTNAIISYYLSGVTLSVQDGNTLVYSATANGSRAFIKFPVTLVVGETYIISFDYVHSYNTTVYLQFGNSPTGTPVTNTTITGLSGRKTYNYTHRSGVTGFYVASSDIPAGNTLTLSNFTIAKKDSVFDVVDDIDERVTELESKQDFDIDVIEDFTNAEVSQSNENVNISINNGVVTIAPTSNGFRGFVKFPAGLVDGKQYVLMFDYTVSASGRKIYCNYSNAPSGTSQGNFTLEGTSGHADNRFTKTSAITGFYIPTSDIGANNTLTMSNFSIVLRGDAEYYINDLYNEDAAEKENLNALNIESEYLQFITQQYKSGVMWSGYSGNPLMGNRFGFEKILNFGSEQGAALFGETAFAIRASGISFGWYNLRTGAGRWVNGRLVNDCPFLSTPDSGWHCNSAQFSNTFYDENDEFPLLYISGSEGTKATMFLVARIVRYNDKYTYHMELVQTVTMPPTITYANIGIENGYLYIQNNTTIYKCAAPAIFDGNGDVIPTVTMADSDILDTMSNAEHPSNPQGCCVHKGVFIGTYGGTSGNRYIATYDLYTKQPINTINYYLMGIDEEPEGVFFYKETMMLWGAHNLYRLWI